MKKIQIFTLCLMAGILSGCNLGAPRNPDGSVQNAAQAPEAPLPNDYTNGGINPYNAPNATIPTRSTQDQIFRRNE